MSIRRLAAASLLALAASAAAADEFEYKVLATGKTSTMEKEMNQAASAGFKMASVMGGDTAFGGKEVVVVMRRGVGQTAGYAYKLLATSKTSTMQKEMNQAAAEGYDYVGQTVFESLFGGQEVVVIMEKSPTGKARNEYLLLATSKTGTMQKELAQAGAQGYDLLGMTVGKTAFGGSELVSILRRAR